jgi:hypothetical protein
MAGVVPERGTSRKAEVSPSPLVTFHNERLSASVKVSNPSVGEQLIEQSHVKVARNVCRRVANPTVVIAPGPDMDAVTSTPSAWYMKRIGTLFARLGTNPSSFP